MAGRRVKQTRLALDPSVSILDVLNSSNLRCWLSINSWPSFDWTNARKWVLRFRPAQWILNSRTGKNFAIYEEEKMRRDLRRREDERCDNQRRVHTAQQTNL